MYKYIQYARREGALVLRRGHRVRASDAGEGGVPRVHRDMCILYTHTHTYRDRSKYRYGLVDADMHITQGRSTRLARRSSGSRVRCSRKR